MKRGLSITAYQFHKLLQYEENYIRLLKNKKILAQAQNIKVPKGDKHDHLRSNSINLKPQNPNIPKKNLFVSQIDKLQISKNKMQQSLNLKNSQSQNLHILHPLKSLKKNKNNVSFPLQSKKINPSHSNNSLRAKTEVNYPKSLNGSAKKISVLYSHGPSRYSARQNEHYLAPQINSFNLYEQPAKYSNGLSKSTHPKIYKHNKGKSQRNSLLKKNNGNFFAQNNNIHSEYNSRNLGHKKSDINSINHYLKIHESINSQNKKKNEIKSKTINSNFSSNGKNVIHYKSKNSKGAKRARTINNSNVNNINIYKTGYSKHLKRSRMTPKHVNKETERIKMIKLNFSQSVPQNFKNYKQRRVAPPKPLKDLIKLRKRNLKKLNKKKNGGGYGNDYYSKTNEELDAEYDAEVSGREKEGFKEKWNEFTQGFLSIFRK